MRYDDLASYLVSKGSYMISIIKQFFSYVPPKPPVEIPKDEPNDPNENRTLSDAVRNARRNLLVVCGLCLAWSSAQFTMADSKMAMLGITLDIKGASIPLVLAVVLIYFIFRWGLEFAMMPRYIRRWPLAQLDFRMSFLIARFALLGLAAGALERSILTIVILIASIMLLAIISSLLSASLIFITMPIRSRARSRAGHPSAAHASMEAILWGGLLAIGITVCGIIGLGFASYHYTPLLNIFWKVPPSPVALSIFVLTFVGIFLSNWLFRPVIRRIFSEQPGYYTERDEDGNILIYFRYKKKEPLI